MTETKEWLNQEIMKVEEWEKEQSDLWFWEKLGRLPFKLIDKWTPNFIQTKIGTIIDELGQYIQTGGNYLSSVTSLNSYYPNYNIHSVEEARNYPFLRWIPQLKN